MTGKTALHLKYRPETLDDIIGHEAAVAKLKGMIASKKFPSALAFFGPTSAGKTTLARAFATTTLGKQAEGSQDFMELNATDNKTIDDIRQLIGISRLRPVSGIRRFLLVDEAQGILSNAQAAACIGPDSRVLTKEFGHLKAQELHLRIEAGEEIHILSFSHLTKNTEWKKVRASRKIDNTKPCVSINGVGLTYDHQVYESSQGVYVNASEVSQVLTLNEGGHLAP